MKKEESFKDQVLQAENEAKKSTTVAMEVLRNSLADKENALKAKEESVTQIMNELNQCKESLHEKEKAVIEIQARISE